MCGCTYADCYGCACGCRHTHDTLRAYREGVQAARDAVAVYYPDTITTQTGQGYEYALRQALAAIDALYQVDTGKQELNEHINLGKQP